MKSCRRDDTAATFGKAAGLGDIEAFCYQPPIEIGNRVWFDQNTDGIQDPGEAPLAGVTLELYQGNTLIATAITDADGNFIFSSGVGNLNDPSVWSQLAAEHRIRDAHPLC